LWCRTLYARRFARPGFFVLTQSGGDGRGPRSHVERTLRVAPRVNDDHAADTDAICREELVECGHVVTPTRPCVMLSTPGRGVGSRFASAARAALLSTAGLVAAIAYLHHQATKDPENSPQAHVRNCSRRAAIASADDDMVMLMKTDLA